MKTKKKSYIRKDDVRIGNTYVAKVSGKLTAIKIFAKRPRVDTKGRKIGGWLAKNLVTGKIVDIKSHMKLRLDLTSILGISTHELNETQDPTGAVGHRNQEESNFPSRADGEDPDRQAGIP